MAIRSSRPDVDIPNVSVPEFIFGDLAAAEREIVAIIDGATGAATTYGELSDQVDAFAGALAHRGIGKGDVVALIAPNGPGFVAAFHGALRAGATVTTVNIISNAADISKQIQNSGAIAVITVDGLRATALPAAQEQGIAAEKTITLDATDADRAAGYLAFADLLAEGHTPPAVTFDPATDVAVLPFSSGTTAAPKGVMLSHRNLVANVNQGLPYLGPDSNSVIMGVLPFFHIYGMTLLVNVALKLRSQLVTMPRFDLEQFLRLHQEHKITHSFIAPPVAVALAKHPLVDKYDLSSLELVFSGAAPLDGALGKLVADRLDCEVRQGYGMSELSPVSHLIGIDVPDAPLDSVGHLVPNSEARLVDPATGDDVELAEGEEWSRPGELWVRGPTVMLGYLNNAAATADTIDPEGWLRTGDIAVVNGDDVFKIVDRLKEIIKYKGYQVAPAELEAVLLTHPEIADAAVVGAIDPESGEEVPKAFVVLREGGELTAEAIKEYVASKVSPYKKVRIVEFIEVIPKSSSGKILRRELRK